MVRVTSPTKTIQHHVRLVKADIDPTPIIFIAAIDAWGQNRAELSLKKCVSNI